eukprot:2337-Eustigmatos_ZCMA.PRE.1
MHELGLSAFQVSRHTCSAAFQLINDIPAPAAGHAETASRDHGLRMSTFLYEPYDGKQCQG